MKRAIGYIRISTTDQSNFSLDSQAEYVQQYCTRQDYELINIFREHGQSAKNFDRANWQDLERFVKDNYRDIDYLIVAKYDRFSRNLSEALQMMEKLENKYNIVVLSVMEDVKLHPKSSMFFMMRTQMLLYAENELRVLKERTKIGMTHGAKQGRHLHTAPFGYKNSKDATGLSILVVDEQKAFIVRKAFAMCLAGVPMQEIHKEVVSLGYTNKGKSAVPRMLANYVYAGMVKVPGSYDEQEYLTEGLHTAIIDKPTYYQVQGILSNRVGNKKVIDTNVPLRGVLRCSCGHPFTAAASKGRNNYYYYYKCNKHNGSNYSADKLHTQFNKILDILSLPEKYIQALKERLAGKVEDRLKDSSKELDARNRALKEVEVKLDRLQEKYILEDITRDVYQKFQAQWLKEKYTIQATIAEMQRPVNEVWSRYEAVLGKLADLSYIFSKANIFQKQSFVSIGFDNTLTYENGVYRTAYILPLWASKVALLKEKGLLYLQQPLVTSANFSLCAPGGT